MATAISDAINWADKQNSVPKFINDVCGLKNIFVIVEPTATLHSRGKWENPNRKYLSLPGSGNKYVAITLADARANLKDKFNAQLWQERMLIDHSNAWHTENIDSKEDTNQLAILFTLAHDLGHINWRSSNLADCFDLKLSWKNTIGDDGVEAKDRQWTEYGADVGKHKNIGIPRPHQQLPKYVRRIYNGSFMTALAAANPEEDFVETYATALLMRVSLSNVYLNTPGATPIRVTDNQNKNSDLQAKLKCITDHAL